MITFCCILAATVIVFTAGALFGAEEMHRWTVRHDHDRMVDSMLHRLMEAR